MLTVSSLSKQFHQNGKPRTLFKDLSFQLGPSERLAVLGRNGQGKSTLIKILGGVLNQTSGHVQWSMSSSWPLGFGGGFQGGLTGIDNIRFLARIYDRSFAEMNEKVRDFAELGDAMTMPVKHYSSGMRARLAFGMSLAIEFDCYLIDEVIAVGDDLFREKCERELFVKRGARAFVIASHDLNFIRKICHRAVIVEHGEAILFDELEEAVEAYSAIGRDRDRDMV